MKQFFVEQITFCHPNLCFFSKNVSTRSGGGITLLILSASAMGIYPEGNNLFFKFFFKEMAVAHSIFTLGGWVQLFWTAFDMPMTGVPLEVALGWQKFYFWVFQKNNQASVT